MNKIIISAIIIACLLLVVYPLKNYQFSIDAIGKIEEQRREHVYYLSSISRVLHNKGVYLSYQILENYLSYFTPATFFCCFHILVALPILFTFYWGFFILLNTNSSIGKKILLWVLIYPIFPALTLKAPTLLLLLPLIIPTFGISIYRLFMVWLDYFLD